MKTLKFNQCSTIVQCQVLTAPARSKNWPLLSKGLVFQLKRCGKRGGIVLFESWWAKAQKNYMYCPKTHKKPKTKLAVSLPNASTMTKCQLMFPTLTFMESHPFLPYPLGSVHLACSKTNALPSHNPLIKASQPPQSSKEDTRNSLIGKCRITYANEGLILTEINFKPWSMNFYGHSKI